MKFGIIGFGRITRKFIESIRYTRDGQIAAVASHSLSPQDPFLLSHPEVQLYRDYHSLLKDPAIEAVYIALPHKEHFRWSLSCLEHGKAVLCEKPLVLSSAEAEEIQKTVQRTGICCMEAIKTRYNLGYQQLKKELFSLGNIEQIRCAFCFDGNQLSSNSYLFQPGQGGALNDIGIYPLSFVLGLCPSEPVELEADIEETNGIDSYFHANMRFANNTTAILEGAIDRNSSRTAWITCSAATVEIPVFNRMTEYTIHYHDGRTVRNEYPFDGDDMTLEIQEFIKTASAHKQESPLYPLQDTIRAIRLIEQIRLIGKR